MSYEVLKNRLTNGTAFLLQTALERINALADTLEITQDQADELITIAQKNGVDVLPDDIQSRIDRIEHILDAFLSAARESPILSAIIDKMEV